MSTTVKKETPKSIFDIANSITSIAGKICTYHGQFFTIYQPFSNCQSFSIGSFCNIIYGEEKNDKIESFLKELAFDYSKPLMVIDVNGEIVDRCKKVFKNFNIIAETPYISSNGSDMCMMIVQIYEPSEYEDDDY